MKIITLILYMLLTSNTYAAATDAQREEFTKDCENNNSVACYNMGLMYNHGDGVTKDDKKALEFYTQACDLNYVKACSSAAFLYEESPTVQTDMKKAFKLYNKACGGDDAFACHNVALHYSNKEGFEKVAISLYDKACSSGYAESCIYLGRLYRDSRKVAPNYALAKEKFDTACELNNYLGCKELRILQELEKAGYSKH